MFIGHYLLKYNLSAKKPKVKKLTMPTKTVHSVKDYSAHLGRFSQNGSHIMYIQDVNSVLL